MVQRVRRAVPLAPTTWFRVGGPAERFIRPATAHELGQLLRETPPEIPVQILGACSNLIIRDGGLPGITLRLGR